MKKSYIVTMRHDEKTLIALSHMQYDLFCVRNYIARNVLAIAAILVGGFYFKQIWGIALLAYGTYLLTSTYASANHTARKLIAQINAGGGEVSLLALFLRGRADPHRLPPRRAGRGGARPRRLRRGAEAGRGPAVSLSLHERPRGLHDPEGRPRRRRGGLSRLRAEQNRHGLPEKPHADEQSQSVDV